MAKPYPETNLFKLGINEELRTTGRYLLQEIVQYSRKHVTEWADIWALFGNTT